MFYSCSLFFSSFFFQNSDVFFFLPNCSPINYAIKHKAPAVGLISSQIQAKVRY